MNHPEALSEQSGNLVLDQTATLLEKIVEAWSLLQTQQPLVQCITNSVAANYAANVLLAAGASPAMIDNHLKQKVLHQYQAHSVLMLAHRHLNKCKPYKFRHKQ